MDSGLRRFLLRVNGYDVVAEENNSDRVRKTRY